MAVCFSILLLLGVVTGICSITTISQVSVKAGKTISIPCLYESSYKNNVKQLCVGYYWLYCKFGDKRYSTEDKRGIFTFTWKTETYNSYFWCTVKVGGAYIREYFSLSVTPGEPRLYTDEQIYTAYTGGNTTIKCKSSVSGVKRWCRLGGDCVPDINGKINGKKVTLNTTVPKGFTVTMTELTSKSEGWYYCEAGDFQMPVYIRVTDMPTANVTSTKNKDTTLEEDQQGSSHDLKSYLVPLGLLIPIVMVLILVCLLFKKRHPKAKASVTAEASATAEDEVTYSTVNHVRQKSTKRASERCMDSMYSSVIPKRGVPTAEDVTYSTLTANYKTNP